MRTTTIFAQTHTSERTMSPTGLLCYCLPVFVKIVECQWFFLIFRPYIHYQNTNTQLHGSTGLMHGRYRLPTGRSKWALHAVWQCLRHYVLIVRLMNYCHAILLQSNCLKFFCSVSAEIWCNPNKTNTKIKTQNAEKSLKTSATCFINYEV